MNEFEEANPVSPVEPAEKPATRVKRAYRKRKVEEALKEVFPKAFVQVETAPPKAGSLRSSRREAALPDPKWMAEFVRALLRGV